MANLRNIDITTLDVPNNDNLVSGVEHLSSMTTLEVLALMGLSETLIPGMEDNIALDRSLIPHSQELWKRSEKKPLRLWRYQLSGVERMLELYFQRLPIFLFDAPGIGKTIQICAFFSMVALNRAFYKTYKTYLGQFSEYPSNWLFTTSKGAYITVQETSKWISQILLF
jgi:hypothetical protein